MSNRTCYLHLGTGKTGSSAIQYALTRAESMLTANGYLYPDLAKNFSKVLAGIPTTGNGKPVNAALHDCDPEAAIAAIEPYIADPRHLILSCEGFANAPGEAWSEFAARLRSLGYTAKGLVFFRPQTEFLVSSYLQQVKAARLDISLSQYINAMSAKRQGGRNWLARAQKLESALGSGALTVKWYPAVRRHGPEALLRTMFEWLGTSFEYQDIPSVKGGTIINPTPGQEALLVLQDLNAGGLGGRSKIADEFLRRAQAQRLLGKKVMLTHDERKQIHAATVADNELLLRRYCPELSPDAELALPEVEAEPGQPDEEIVRKLRIIADDILARGKRNPVRWWTTRMLRSVGIGTEQPNSVVPSVRRPRWLRKGSALKLALDRVFRLPRRGSAEGQPRSARRDLRKARRRARVERGTSDE